MAKVTQQLSSASTQARKSKETLSRSLDDLLERYLNLLHEYQMLQQDLSKGLSLGYISLAQANFSNVNRIRYGQDFYDDRMQASTRVSISSSKPFFSILQLPQLPFAQAPNDNDADTPSYTPSHPSKADDIEETKKHGSLDPDPKPHPRNPVDWFGILAPPALRQSQAAFNSATISIIPAMANAAKEMKELEIEVRRTRKSLRKAG